MVNQSQSPGKQVWQRFRRNPFAVAGLVVIAVFVVIGLLGYLIMPDSTPEANRSIYEIRKEPPGFTVDLLKVRNNKPVHAPGVTGKLLFGREDSVRWRPYTKWRYKGDQHVEIDIYGGKGRVKETYALPQIVLPLYPLADKEFGFNAEHYKLENDQVIYMTPGKQLDTIPLETVKQRFEQHHLQRETFLLGTDKAGRDMLSRLILGTRVSLSIGLITVLISLVIGVSFGALAGFFGGMTDQFLLWFISVLWSVPRIMLVIAISLAIQTKGITVAFTAIGLTMWVEMARVVRGQIMEVKEKLYIEAAKAVGIPNMRIIFRHMLPNLLGPLIVVMTASFAEAILVEAGLSFLGMSVQPPTPSWGLMVNEGYAFITSENGWHMIMFPALCISLVVLSFNLSGNGLRDAVDPKSS